MTHKYTQDNQDGLMIYEKYRDLCQKSLSSTTNYMRNNVCIRNVCIRNLGKCELRADAPNDLLMPRKVEIYSQNPRIELHHDLISSELADVISELSHDNLVSLRTLLSSVSNGFTNLQNSPLTLS